MSSSKSRFIQIIITSFAVSLLYITVVNITSSSVLILTTVQVDYRRRPECTCSRAQLPSLASSLLTKQNETHLSLCSQYATQRGPNQRIIAISLFGPTENKIFQFNRTLYFLYELIKDLDKIYSDQFILRIYHDKTINTTDIICPIECQHHNVDFCSMDHKLFIPPKIWRFIPAGDSLVDIMMSRDLDSAFTVRERAAVDAWLTSNKSFHIMRDHPYHDIPMLGGMWGFRPSLNPAIAQIIHNKIHDQNLIKNYSGRGDQTFLFSHIWPIAQSSLIAHDSFHCKHGFGHKTEPFPTRRPSANETNCFVGCIRPCCGEDKMPFKPCPERCRPKNHSEWIYC